MIIDLFSRRCLICIVRLKYALVINLFLISVIYNYIQSDFQFLHWHVPVKPASRSNYLCVLVPYRDRQAELDRFIPHMHAFLREQNVSHQIIILNQTDSYRFNRASLINVGWYEADRIGCNYIVMHDVDLLPLNPNISYSYPGIGIVRHISSPQYHPRYKYKNFIGGILLLTLADYKRVNGMSNKYWGWGLEDDDFYLRLKDANLISNLQRPNNLVTNRSNTFLHLHTRDRKRDSGRTTNQKIVYVMELSFSECEVLSDLHWLSRECDRRCLFDGAQWANELIFYIQDDWYKKAQDANVCEGKETAKKPDPHARTTQHGISLIKTRDFYRAVFFLKKTKNASSFHRFLYFYARYLACERTRLENGAYVLHRRMKFDHSELVLLHGELNDSEDRNNVIADPFLLYVLGRIRLSLDLKEEAKTAFLESIKVNQAFWPSWQELIYLIDSIEEMESSDVISDDYWMCHFFKADLFCRMNSRPSTLEQCERLVEAGFSNIPHILNLMAWSYNNAHAHEQSVEQFNKVLKLDPLRIEQMHFFSDSLYVRSMRSELASLAHAFFKTHKFTWEACYIVANYFSLRGEHDRSVTFLLRAVRINPRSSSAWTLIGHEFMEQKNHSAACLAYRRAIDIDRLDYRGWYALGQLYDIMKAPSYSLFYYHQAYKCRSDDSRILIALGEAYRTLFRINDAYNCFLKAFKVGDVEGNALMHLAMLFDAVSKKDEAAAAYEKYLDLYGEEFFNEGEDLAMCCLYLAKYYLDKGDLDTSSTFAQRCLEFDMTKDEGRSILRTLNQTHQRLSLVNTSAVIVPAVSTSTPEQTASAHQPPDIMRTPTFSPSSASVELHDTTTDNVEMDMLMSSDDSE